QYGDRAQLVAANDISTESIKPPYIPPEPPAPKKRKASDCSEVDPRSTPRVAAVGPTHYDSRTGRYEPGYYWGDVNVGSGFKDKDFLIIIAAVGVIAVVALLVYSVSYISEASKAGVDCRSFDDVGLRFSYLEDRSSNQSRVGSLSG